MPQVPLRDEMAAGVDAAPSRGSQVVQAVSELANRGRAATDGLSSRAVGVARGSLDFCGQLPSAVIQQIRQRVNLLDLATKDDVESQSKLGRNRVSYVLKEFLETQRGHEEQLLESLRTELREELQSFAAAIGDDLFAMQTARPATTPIADAYLEDDKEDEEEEDDELFELELELEPGAEFELDDDDLLTRE
jgi:hypothetical protein